MRKLLYLVLVLFIFTAIGCPPAPPPEVNRPGEAKTAPRREPLPEMPSSLKARVDAAIEHVESRTLTTDNAFWTVFHGILGSGLDKTMLKDTANGKRVNAIDYISKGGTIRGMQFLPTPDGLDVQSASSMDMQGIYQGHQDQFVAEMTQWGMRKEQPFQVGKFHFTFDDFVKQSRARASVMQTPPQELSWAVLIIAHFYGTNHTWTNNLGEKLSLEDVVRYELNQPIEDGAACGGTHRLFGLTWAYHLHLKNGGKNEGVWKDVETKIRKYKDLAHAQQNSDGAFSTDYFKGKGNKEDEQLRIATTGHTVEWLALAMTDEELRSDWMQSAVSALAIMILEMRNQSIDSGGLYHATHGLRLYRDRVFGTPAAYLPLLPRK
jgi:hypothetical protein